MDNKLSIALKRSALSLSSESISEFYFLGLSLKPRAYNPSFYTTIDLVSRALFHFLDPNECIDHAVKKMKGNYYSKKKEIFYFEDRDLILQELKNSKRYRYKEQIDFSIQLQDPLERNPFVLAEIKRSAIDLNAKIIFKDFKVYLNGDKEAELFPFPFFKALKGGTSILLIEDFAEIWYHQDQIFSLSHIK